MDISSDTTCSSLLRELQHIWDEVGESDAERDKMLLQLEQECLEVYRRKVDQANSCRARLRKAIADSEAEMVSLFATLGDHNRLPRSDKRSGTLKDQLLEIHPQLEELRKMKEDRLNQLATVKERIHGILVEIAGCTDIDDAAMFSSAADEDLSLRKLEEFSAHLQALEKEKGDRLAKVKESIDTIHSLCSVLDLDDAKVLADIHPTLTKTSGPKSISDGTLDSLELRMQALRLEKRKRLNKMQDLCASMVELWSLMDTPTEERESFMRFTTVLGAEETEISDFGILSRENMTQLDSELQRLDTLKVSKMRELVLKKQKELDIICSEAHMEAKSAFQKQIMALVESGNFDASELLESMDLQISSAKEEARSRREIMEKMEKWISACEEETWLEDYNNDENRYNASRGAHINLKRAEKARVLMQKLPSMIENLIQKTKSWEEEHATHFIYDGIRLLHVLEEQNQQKKEREQEKKRIRDQKKHHEQIVVEQEALFGTRSSPQKPPSAKKGLSVRSNNTPANLTPNRRLSAGISNLKGEVAKKTGITPVRSATKDSKKEKSRPTAPVNYVAIGKEDL